MAPRSIWNGAVAFGLVQVPIKVYSATESKTVHFHEVHLKDSSRIEHRRVCSREDKEVPYDDIVKGFEVKQGEWVELTDDEIAAAAGSRNKLIDVEHFVPAEEIDPDFYERAYFLGPGDKGRRRLRRPARRAREDGQSRDRPLGLPRPPAHGRDQDVREGAGAEHAAPRRRPRRPRRLRPSPREQEAQRSRAQDGVLAGRGPARQI